MSFTTTAPTAIDIRGRTRVEVWTVSAGLGSETQSGTISAKFLRRIDRADFIGTEVLSKTITNSTFPPTVAFEITGPFAQQAGGNVTIATTSNTDFYVICQRGGTVVGVDFSGVDALAASDTNFITWSITNLGQAGAGSNPILAATAANTTQVTGGTALAANTKRSLTLNGTGSNLIVVAGDRLRVRAVATGTLANTVTFSTYEIRFAGPTEGYIILESDTA